MVWHARDVQRASCHNQTLISQKQVIIHAIIYSAYWLYTHLAQNMAAAPMLLNLLQVGILRRGKYFKGKKVGKGNAVNEV